MRRCALTLLVVLGALFLAASAPGGGQAPVKDGKYAGGADRFHIYFDVNSRSIPFARVYSHDLQTCNGFGGPAIFGSDVVDGRGRFTLRDDTTHANNDFKVKGRFIRRNHVVGTVEWTTTDDCPAGIYEFQFKADRFAPVG
ncbi:MAG: hypothetical protein ACR2G3_00490 [Solirubrobacterales bacterium]